MPRYEYACDCGETREVTHKMSENPDVCCPKCGEKMHRLISAPARIDLRGSGFYINDYKNIIKEEAKK